MVKDIKGILDVKMSSLKGNIKKGNSWSRKNSLNPFFSKWIRHDSFFH